jgi:hypothetical protein
VLYIPLELSRFRDSWFRNHIVRAKSQANQGAVFYKVSSFHFEIYSK